MVGIVVYLLRVFNVPQPHLMVYSLFVAAWFVMSHCIIQLNFLLVLVNFAVINQKAILPADSLYPTVFVYDLGRKLSTILVH
jgi:hypothetical protein